MTEGQTVAETTKSDETRWPDYYEVPAERSAWTTTRTAVEASGEHPATGPRFAVDLGCGAGRDTRELRRAAIPVGGRCSGMLFGDKDQSAGEPDMTCPSPGARRSHLGGLEIEHWSGKEEDGTTALGDPHHFCLIEVVAVRSA